MEKLWKIELSYDYQWIRWAGGCLSKGGGCARAKPQTNKNKKFARLLGKSIDTISAKDYNPYHTNREL